MRERLAAWFERHPVWAAAILLAMFTVGIWSLLERLEEALSYVPADERSSAVFRGSMWAAAIAAGVALAAILRRVWWSPAILRKVVLGAIVAVSLVGLLLTAPDKYGDPPGAGLCSTWKCVASSLVTWIASFSVLPVLLVVLTARQRRYRRIHGIFRGWSRPTGRPCAPVVTAVERRAEDPASGSVYFVACDCGFIGRARSSELAAQDDARKHAPDVVARREIPPALASPGPHR